MSSGRFAYIRHASSTSNATSPTTMEPKARSTQQKQEAKKIWAETEPLIRNDWQWPNPPHSTRQIDTSQEYAERTISTPSETLIDLTSAAGTKRKREIRVDLLEEMKWNSGLRTFEQRRNAWTGAVHVFLPPEESTEHVTVQSMREKPLEMLTMVKNSQDEWSDDVSIDYTASEPENLDPSIHVLGTTLLPHYLPVLPKSSSLIQPLLNPIAEKVLYKNLVTDGKTATFPIPLANVVKACVTGLKEADEWPPKAGAIDPLPGRINKEKRRSRIKSLFGLKKDHNDANNVATALRDSGITAIEAGFESTSR